MTPPWRRAGDPAIAGETRFGLLALLGTLMFLTVLMLLEQAGMPDRIGYVLTSIMLVAVLSISGVVANTSQIGDWQSSGRLAAPLILGMSLAATLFSGQLLAALPGSFFAGSQAAAAYLLGPLLGLAAGSLLVSPHVRKSGAGAPAEYFRLRFANRFPAFLALTATLAGSVLVMWAQFRMIAEIGTLTFRLDAAFTTAIAAGMTALAVLPGGLRGLIRTNALAMVLIGIATLAPVIWLSTILAGLPLPQIAYGPGALSEIGELEAQLSSVGIPPLAQAMSDALPAATGLALAALSAFLFLGFLAFPPLLSQMVAARRIGTTKLAGAWAILLAGAVLTAAPAAAAFAKLAIYDGIFGLTAGETGQAAPWLLAYGSVFAPLSENTPLVTLCGRQVADLAAAIAACGGDPDYALGPADLAMRGEIVGLALPEIATIPSAFTMALAAGATAAALAMANGAAFSFSAVLALGGPASGLNRVFLGRVAVAAGIVLAAALALRYPVAPLAPMLWALAVFSGVLAPAFLLAIWWDRMTAMSCTLGMASSIAAVAAIAAAATVGTDLSPGSGDEFLFNIPGLDNLPLPVLAGVAGVACGLPIAVIAAFLPGRRLSSGELELLRVPDARPSIDGDAQT
jgi:cation/acetate symporter